jgi:hypothetical protein
MKTMWIIRATLGMSPDHDLIGVNRRGIGVIGVPRLNPSGA